MGLQLSGFRGHAKSMVDEVSQAMTGLAQADRNRILGGTALSLYPALA